MERKVKGCLGSIALTLSTLLQSAQAQSDGNLAAALPGLVRNTQQIVLSAPTLQRADLTESLRRAVVERGSEVILLTDRSTFWTNNSLTLRLVYIGAKTYDVGKSGQPFIILDGQVIVGPGVTGGGSARLQPNNAAILNWTQNILKRQVPLRPVDQTREWLKRAKIKPNPGDLPPREPPRVDSAP